MNLLLEFLKDLLPNKDLPTGAWIGRVVTLFLIAILSIQYLSSLLRDTTIARNYGLVKLDKDIGLTHVAFTRLIRKTRRDLRRLIGNESAIKAALVVANYNSVSGQFSASNSDKNKIIVWEFASPENLFLSITNLEIYLKGANPELSEFETKACRISKLSDETKLLLFDSVNLENVTHWLKCPIYLIGSNNDIAVAYNLVFFKLNELKENGSSTNKLIANVWNLNESISDSYSYFNISILDSKD